MRGLSIAIFLLFASMAQGQQLGSCDYTVTGVVLDEHNGEALGFSNVLILETGLGAAADEQGIFTLRGICQGNYTLRVSHVGCETRDFPLSINDDVEVTFQLEHHAELLEAIELSAKRAQQAISAIHTTLDQKDLELTYGQTLGEAMSSVPGITTLQTGPNVYKPLIHGLHSTRILILNDGVRHESQQWGLDHAPEIDPHTASRITVVKGAAAVQYGADAVAGVILIESDRLPRQHTVNGRIRSAFSLNGRQLTSSLTLERGTGNGWGVRFSGTFKRGGDMRASDYNLTNTGVSETNFSLDAGRKNGLNGFRVSYKLFRTKLGILRSAHIGNLTDLEEALERDRPLVVEPFSYDINSPRQEVDHHVIGLAGTKYVTDIGLLSGHYTIQLNRRQEFDFRRGVSDDVPALDLDLQTHTADLRLAHEAVLGLRGKIGLHWSYKSNENTPGTGVRPLIPNYTQYMPGISWLEKWNRGAVEAELGLRYEFAWLQVKKFDQNGTLIEPVFRFHNVSTTAGIRWEMSSKFTVYSHFGSTKRAPNVNELFSEGLHHGAAAVEEGDTSLTSEHAFKLAIGGIVETTRLRAEMTTYLQRIDDFIYLYPGDEPQLTIRGAFPTFHYVQNDVVIYGLDVSARVRFTSAFALESSFSLVRGRNTDLNEDLINMPSDRTENTLVWTSPESGWNAAVGINHVRKQSMVPEDADFAPPPDAYTLVSARAGKALTVFGNTLNIDVAVQNALNTSYREYLNRLRYYADDLGRNITLKLHYDF